MLSTCAALMLLASSLFLNLSAAEADAANAPSLTISQLKITSSNGQFITLHNMTAATLDMSKYQLQYFNSYDLAKATSSRLISLSGAVPPHGYFMVNDSQMLLCYQLAIDSVSLGLSSTAGMIQVMAYDQSSPGTSVTPVLQDYVGWTKTAAAGAQTLPASTSAFLRRLPLDGNNDAIVTSPGSGSWQTVQPDTNNPCSLVTASNTPVNMPTGLNLLLPSAPPPATFVDTDPETGTVAPSVALPAADIGLMAPQINELLPNPDGTGNDATDEYIELYNANDKPFDLSGFGLQTGLTTLRKYTFPAGTSLAPKSFTAFYSEATGLSLSNTSGQAKLLDPAGNSVSSSEVYSSAKDGRAWALANGKWYWTTSVTPNAANVIKQPASGEKSATSSKTSKAVKTAVAKSAKSKTKAAAKVSGALNDQPAVTPIHTRVLALVAGLALLYGAYEYRADLAGKIYRLKRYFGARFSNRPPA